MPFTPDAPPSPQPALKVQGLRAGYGRHDVLTDLSIDAIKAGEVTALLGPNGSGKSTLLKALAGLIPARAGKVSLGEQDLTHAGFGERARHVVYLPQSLPPAVHLRAFESVLVAANAQGGLSQNRSIPVIEDLLVRLGIGHLALRFLDELSGGQKQLVGLAQALIRQPRVLLLDEPLSALDLNYQFHVMSLLRHETRVRGLITVTVLHDLNTALQHTDHALILQSGRVTAVGSPAEIITPVALANVYGIHGRVEACSRGLRHVLIDGLDHDIH